MLCEKPSKEPRHFTREGVSIIVPVYNREDTLRDLFETLKCAIKNFSKKSEVIIVDSSSSGIAKIIRKLCDNYGYKYIWLPRYRRSSGARNVGINHAKYDVVLFIDSDCTVDKNLLNEHFNMYTNTRIGGVAGVTIFKGARKFGFKIMEATPYMLPFSFAKNFKEVTWAPTSNISYRKRVLVDVGLFDEDIPISAAGEDVLIGWKVVKRGYAIITNPNAIVYHTTKTWNSLRQNIHRAFKWGRADYYLLRKGDVKNLDYPKHGIMIFSLILICLYYFLILHERMFILVPLALAPIYILLWALVLKLKGNKHKLLYIVSSRLLVLAFEIGYVIEALRNRDISALFYKVIHIPGRAAPQQTKRILTVWLILLITILIALSLPLRLFINCSLT